MLLAGLLLALVGSAAGPAQPLAAMTVIDALGAGAELLAALIGPLHDDRGHGVLGVT